MSRLSLDVSTLQVESFGAEPALVQSTGGQTYPDCPTATGCTCVDGCGSLVRVCPDTGTYAV